jgi:hypothetical protein
VINSADYVAEGISSSVTQTLTSLSIQVTLSYKGFNLSMLMSYTAGEIFTRKLIAAIQGRGLTADTEDRLNILLFYQVLLRQEQTNTTQINNSSYYFNNLGFGPSEEFMTAR